jgi:hypothetical protein
MLPLLEFLDAGVGVARFFSDVYDNLLLVANVFAC